MLLIITVTLPTRSAMLISPARTRGSTIAWSMQQAAPEQGLVIHHLLAPPGERLPSPESTGFGDPNPRRGWLASPRGQAPLSERAPVLGKKGNWLLGKADVLSCEVGTIPILHGNDGLRPPWRQAGQGAKASDTIPLTCPEESRENLLLQKKGGCFPSETETLMKGRGQKIGRNDC